MSERDITERLRIRADLYDNVRTKRLFLYAADEIERLRPLDMMLCEQERLILRPGVTYRFSVDETCSRCTRIAAQFDTPDLTHRPGRAL